MKKIILLFIVLLIVGCTKVPEPEKTTIKECYPELLYDYDMLLNMSAETEHDMKQMMPRFEWNIYVEGNCIITELWKK